MEEAEERGGGGAVGRGSLCAASVLCCAVLRSGQGEGWEGSLSHGSDEPANTPGKKGGLRKRQMKRRDEAT